MNRGVGLPSTADDVRPMRMLARLRLLIGERLGWVVGLVIASILAGLSEAGILAITAQAAADLVHGTKRIHHVGPLSLDVSLQTLLLVALGLAVARLLLQLVTAYLPALIAGHVQADMRTRLFAAYTMASWSSKSQALEGHFQELMTNQVMQGSQGALQATIFVVSTFTFLVLAVSAFALSALVAFAVLGASILLFAFLRPFTRLGSRLAHRLSAAQLAYAGSVGEATNVAEETQVFGVGPAQMHRVDGFIAAARRLFVRTQSLARLIPNTYQSVVYLILVAGLLLISAADATNFPALGGVVLLLVRASSYGQQLQTSYQLVRQTMPYVERVQEATDRYREAREPVGRLRLDAVRLLTFDGVGYTYPEGREVLSDLTFQVTAGETIGVVGPSGAGKSTMVQILLRLRPPTEGAYLANGVPVAEYRSDDWHRHVSYVPQQPRLIYATVADNVRLFRSDIDDDAIEHACRLARIHDDITSWSEGYQTIIGPRAKAVSGGQQQRICLARALAAQPELLVLDEPTSALDPRSEAMIQESLDTLRKELTIFIIAHRMSTLSICDRVMVILNGRLDAFEKLEILKASNDYYRLASAVATSFDGSEEEMDRLPHDPGTRAL